MIKQFLSTWIKRFLKGVCSICNRKGFDWNELGNTAIRETALTVLTVCLTVVTMNVLGVTGVVPV
jgi:hypothetical protein